MNNLHFVEFDIVDMLFCVCRFSKASFNAQTSSLISLHLKTLLPSWHYDMYGRLPWHFYNFTCEIINEH